MGPLLPVVIVTLVCGAVVRSRGSDHGVLTPQRKIVFETAMAKLKDPKKLETLAAAFEGEGLKACAIVLRKRANLANLPPETKRERREILRKCLASKNPDAVQGVADAHRQEGATGAADMLDQYAAGLRASA